MSEDISKGEGSKEVNLEDLSAAKTGHLQWWFCFFVSKNAMGLSQCSLKQIKLPGYKIPVSTVIAPCQ